MNIGLLKKESAHRPITRPCDICGKPFASKNDKAAHMMITGKLRVCDDCRQQGARTQLTYSEYLKTDHWKARRLKALALGENKCRVCGVESGRLEVHHNTYERLGHERDADLVVLCRDCHKLFHDNGNLAY